MGTAIDLHITRRNWPIRGKFRIARGSKSAAMVIEVCLQHKEFIGRAECVPYARYGESMDSVYAQIEALRGRLQKGLSRKQLQQALPAGAARNALDCAMWDLEAQFQQKPVWELAALAAPVNQITAYTLSLSTPEKMAIAAKNAKDYPLLKIKLAGDATDILRVTNICTARPDAKLILDGNEGFDENSLQNLCDQIDHLPIAVIEQPLPAAQDQSLVHIKTNISFCADESLHTADDLAKIAKRYQMINIKLDKTGGLTQALYLRQQAKSLGLQIMIGCMVASSLSMLPALLLANDATLVDLDGPVLLEADHPQGLQYSGARILAQSSNLWGYPRPLRT